MTRSRLLWCIVAGLAQVSVAAPRQALHGVEASQAAPLAEPRQISAYVREVFEDRDGTFWFGTNDEGVARHDGRSLVYLSTTDGLGGNAVRGIAQDPRGSLWFATDGGLSRYENGRFTTYGVKDGLPSADLWSLLCDREGTIWVGTAEGVCRRAGERFEPFPLPRVHVQAPESRFSPKVVFAMCEDRNGHLWFGTDGEGVHRYDGTNVRSFTTKEGLGGNMVRALCEDRRGDIWIGTDGGGATRWDGSTLQVFGKKDGLGNERVFEILEDRSGALWFSTLGAGAWRYDGTTFESAAERGLCFDGIPCACGSGKPTPECHGTGGVHVQDLFEDRAGRLWFGCSGGLFRMEGDRIENVTREGPWPARDAATVALAPLGRMTAGEWRVTFASGTTQFDRWAWGPGRHSVESETYGTDAMGAPWRALAIYYWHPADRTIRVMSAHPEVATIGWGIAEGAADTSDARIVARMSLTQSVRADVPRALETRFDFADSYRYHATLLEDVGNGFVPLVDWSYARSRELSALPAVTAEAATPSERMALFAPLVGAPRRFVREGEGEGAALAVDATFEWIPYIKAIRVRLTIHAETPLGRTVDVYLFRAADDSTIRVVALGDSGAMLEGYATASGHAVDATLTGKDGARTIGATVRLARADDQSFLVRVTSSVSGVEAGSTLELRSRN